MTTIYFIRHGQKESHAGDPGLTDLGVDQAVESGKYLSQFPISKIISSPYKRTAQTAHKIAEILELKYSCDDALVERINWDQNTGSKQDFFVEWNKTTIDRDYIPKYGDSSRKSGERIHKLVCKHKQDDAHIAFVSHGGTIVDYLRNVLGDKKVSSLRTRYPEGMDYQMFNCAISTIIVTDKIELDLLNFVDHLSDVSE